MVDKKIILKQLFKKRLDEDELFTHLRTSKYKRDIREYFADLLINSTHWGGVDSYFHSDIHKKLTQRWWELLLGNYLLHHFPSKVKSLAKGPDYLVNHELGNIYIECIAPFPKKGEANIRDKNRTGGSLDSKSALLRFTSAVKEKAENKLKNYLNKGYVKENDFLIIAVNLMEIPNIDLMQETGNMSFLLRGLLGMGEFVFKVPVSLRNIKPAKKVIPTIKPSYVGEISNANGSPIALRKFLTGDYNHISAIIISCDRYLETPKDGKRFSILYNPTARNKLPNNFFPDLGRTFYCENNYVLMQPLKKI